MEVSKPRNLVIVFILDERTENLQIEVEFYRAPSVPPEIWALLVPKMEGRLVVKETQKGLPPKKRSKVEELVLGLMEQPAASTKQLKMKALIWNVRGANSKAVLWHALDLVKMHPPDIMILIETKCSSLRADQATQRLGYSNFRIIPSFGKRGGIWLMWKADITLLNYADSQPNHFHALFKMKPNLPEVLITGMHAPSVATDRNKYWIDLSEDSPSKGTPWLVAGDLNEVLSSSEKMGGR